MKEFADGMFNLNDENYFKAISCFDNCINSGYNLPSSYFYHGLSYLEFSLDGFKLLLIKRSLLINSINSLSKAKDLGHNYLDCIHSLCLAHYAKDCTTIFGSSNGKSEDYLSCYSELKYLSEERVSQLRRQIVVIKKNMGLYGVR